MPIESKEHEGRRVVEKRLDGRLRHDRLAVDRLRAEGAFLERLQATGVVPRLVAHGDDSLGPFVIMEALSFPTLAERVDREGPCHVDAVAAYAALAAIHEAGVLHADLSPSNLAIASDGSVIVLDFGLAIARETDAHDRDGAFAGTIAYAAPEIARGEAPTVASDLFSLAACLLFARSGTSPRSATTLAAGILEAAETPIHAADLSPPLAACLAFDPAARPASARSVVDVLQRRA